MARSVLRIICALGLGVGIFIAFAPLSVEADPAADFGEQRVNCGSVLSPSVSDVRPRDGRGCDSAIAKREPYMWSSLGIGLLAGIVTFATRRMQA